MEDILLKAEPRTARGKKSELTALRVKRLIPAVVYGGEKPSMSVVVSEKELAVLTKAGGANAIIHLKHEQGEDTVILKELKRHAVSNQPIHADFQRISLKRKIEVKVPLHVVGEAPGVKLHGGILEHILREFKVKCLPTQIPHHIDVDVSALELNASLHVKDIAVPEGIEILDAADHIVINVVQPTEEEAAPAAEGAAAVPGAAEPEVIAKGKKDEEGVVVAEKGKPVAAAAEKGKAPAAPAGEKKKEGGK